MVLASLVARAGFQVDAVADGEMALSLLGAQPPDIVLLDIQLPRLDGWEVCRAIKATEATAHTPVVMLTAFPSADARERSLAAGADEYVEKPYRAESLLGIIEQLITIRESARQLDPGEAAVVTAMSGTRKDGRA